MTPEAILRNSERRERRSRFSLKRLARVIRKVGSKVSASLSNTADILMCRMSTPVSSDSDEESIIRVRMIPASPVTNVLINSHIEESIVHNQEKDNSTTECSTEGSKKCSSEDHAPGDLNVSESIPAGVSMNSSKSSCISEIIQAGDNPKLHSLQDECTFCTDSTDPINTSLSISEGLYKETSSIRSIIPSSVHKTNHTIISCVEEFIEQLYRIVIHSSPMRDSSYLPVLMLFYLKQRKYTIPSDLIAAEELFHVVSADSSTATSEDLPDEVVEYLIAEGLEPTVCINYWMAYRCTLEQVYSKFYRSLLTAVLAPNKTHTRTESTLLFYREVLFCVRDLISYSLADMQEEVHTNTDFTEETLFTNLLETLSQSKRVREFFMHRRVTSQSNNKPSVCDKGPVEASDQADTNDQVQADTNDQVQVGINDQTDANDQIQVEAIGQVQVEASDQADTNDQVQADTNDQVQAGINTSGQVDTVVQIDVKTPDQVQVEVAAGIPDQADTNDQVQVATGTPDQVQVATGTPDQVQVATEPSDQVQSCTSSYISVPVDGGDLEYTHPSIVYEVDWSAEAQKDSVPLISGTSTGVSAYLQECEQAHCNKASSGTGDLFHSVSNTSAADPLITDLELSPLFLKQKTKHDLLI
ncbi:hypothetical protein NEPAR05_0870 [Nematocida parisii]|nr:hypothetical protein NEPAR05_0870 [Nematocida parisii]